MRDTDTQSTATDAHTAVRSTHPDTHTCTVKLSDMQLEHGAADEVPQDKHSREDSSAETQVKVRTVQFLLGELRALIVGQGELRVSQMSVIQGTMETL